MSSRVDFRLESLDLRIEVMIFESRVRFEWLFTSYKIFRCFLLVEREELDLGVDLRCQGQIYMLVLFTWDL